MRLAFFPILVLLSSQVDAHEIHMKDGRVIKATSCWEDGDMVRFEKYGGVVGISKDLVKEIVYEKVAPRSGVYVVDRYKTRISPGKSMEGIKFTPYSQTTSKGVSSSLGSFTSQNEGLIQLKTSQKRESLRRAQEIQSQTEYRRITQEVLWNGQHPGRYLENPYSTHHDYKSESDRISKETLWDGQNPGKYADNPYSTHHHFHSESERIVKQSLWDGQHPGRYQDNPYSKSNELGWPQRQWNQIPD